MIEVSCFSGKKVALFGLGGSGMVTAHALVGGGAEVVAFDDRAESCDKAKAAGLTVTDLREIDWSAIDALVLSPGVPLTHPKPHWSVDLAHAAGVEVIGDVELFARERRFRCKAASIIAITGTNGKSTTTALIGHILREAGRQVGVGGNIGRAVLDLEPFAPGRIYVVECSSYQIDLAPSLDPDVGILLNLTPDHLDRHGDMQHYAAIKERLVAQSDMAIIGADDSYCREIAARLTRAGRDVVAISKQKDGVAWGLAFDGAGILEVTEDEAPQIIDLANHAVLRGAHNGQNVAAAVAACTAVGLTLDEIAAGIASFAGLAHRMQPVGKRGEVVFVNDSKATNADAAAPALQTFNNIYWIAGGRPKQGGIASLVSLFPKITKAFLIGEAADAFAGTLAGHVDTEISGTLPAAVSAAAAEAAKSGAPSPVVLLSPACASFDQFKSFEARGDAFVELVQKLDGVEPIAVASEEI